MDAAAAAAMDLDDHHPPQPGPSRPRPPSPPLIYSPPFPPPPPPPISGSQDLLTRYRLMPYYQHYARPYISPVYSATQRAHPGGGERERERERKRREKLKEVKFVGFVLPTPVNGTPGPSSAAAAAAAAPAAEKPSAGVKLEEPEPDRPNGKPDKGKGKAQESSKEKPRGGAAKDNKGKSLTGGAPPPTLPGPAKPKGKRKSTKLPSLKKGYRHYLWGLKGRMSTRQDTTLKDLIFAPPKQHLEVRGFEGRVLGEAMRLEEGQLEGYDPARYTDSPMVSHKRKRKLLKRQQKLAERARLREARSTTTNPAVPSHPASASTSTLHPPNSSTVHVNPGGVPTPATTSGGTPPASPAAPAGAGGGGGGGGRKLVGGSGLKNALVPSPSTPRLSSSSSPLPPSAPSRPTTSQPRPPQGGKAPTRTSEKRKEPPDRAEVDRERERAVGGKGVGVVGGGKVGKKRKVNGAVGGR